MKKLARKLLIAAGIVLGMLAVIIVIEHFRGKVAFNSRLKDLSNSGEQLSVQELQPATVTPDQNGALVLLQRDQTIDASSELRYAFPPVMKLMASGKAQTGWKMEEWVDVEDSITGWEQALAALEQSSNVIALGHAIALKPGFHSGFDYSKGFADFNYPEVWRIRGIVQTLGAAVQRALREGNSDQAEEHLHAMLRMVELLKHERLIISQLIRQACASDAWAATWEFLQSPDVQEAQLNRLQASWQTNQFVKDMVISLEMERAMSLDYFRKLRASARTRSRIAQESGDTAGFPIADISPPTSGFVLRHVHLPLWRIAWADQDALNALNRWQQIIDLGRVARDESWASAIPAFEQMMDDVTMIPFLDLPADQPTTSLYDRWRYLFSGSSFSVTGHAVRRASRMQTQQEMMVAAIALKRFELINGRFPESLDDLAPKYLTAPPKDWMDGQQLRYQQSGKGYTLYSVGDDGQDDGGDASPIGEKKFSNIWDGQDAIWPEPVDTLEH